MFGKHFKRHVVIDASPADIANFRQSHPDSQAEIVECYFRGLRLSRALRRHDLSLGHKRYYTVETLRQGLDLAGFKIIRLEGIYLKPLTTTQMLSHNFNQRIIDAFCLVAIDHPELSCPRLAEVTEVIL